VSATKLTLPVLITGFVLPLCGCASSTSDRSLTSITDNSAVYGTTAPGAGTLETPIEDNTPWIDSARNPEAGYVPARPY
jgi:hypothetical protein